MWASLGLTTKITIIGVALAVVIGGIVGTVFSLEKIGYDKCKNEYQAAANKRLQDAHAEIMKQSEEYEKIHQKLQAVKNRDNPVSPVISLAIDSLPTR